MRVFFRNYRDNLGVSTKLPLEGSVWQVLEIFENLPEDDGSFLGLVDEDGISLQFAKYNKYVWLVEMPMPDMGGSFQGFFTRNKCKRIIADIFEGMAFQKVKGLSFEKYL